jgi:uncharacterized protein
MLITTFGEILLLFGLGLLGWLALAKLRMPASEILGPAALIGTLRVLQVDLPLSPPFLFPVAQIIIGIFVGSMLTRQTVRELKPMALSAAIIVAWALSIIFAIGFFLDRFTALDLYTAMLSASMGGLPEITIIALASGASIAVIVVTQMLRLIGTVLIFPVILKWLEKRAAGGAGNGNHEPDRRESRKAVNEPAAGSGCEKPEGPVERIRAYFSRESIRIRARTFRLSWKRIVFTLIVASSGGLLFNALGVPAGLLVGATVFIAAVSVSGAKVSKLSPRLFDLLLVFIGISIADNISAETVKTIGNPELLIPILIATTVIFATSFVISAVIHRLTGWDYPTCFLAAAPGGFTMMTALAIKSGLDPLKVSMLHLCRLLSINMLIPFIFMFLIR